MSHPVRAVRRRIQRDHTSVVTGVDYCADQVVDSWDGDRTTDCEAVTRPLRSLLESSGLFETLPAVLADVVDAAGCELPAPPVAGPPYVVVTSRGPILRATIDPGRLVIRFDVFEVEHGADVWYRRLDGVRLEILLV